MKKLPFSDLVERRMRERGLSLRAVCREAKLDASFFSKVLSGKRSPPSEESVLRKLAAILGIDPIELIVATGRIPSEWQPLFRDPAVLGSLARMAAPSSRARAEPARIATSSVSVRAVPAVSRPFSDDLL
jgi:transcriptional regulator with XRE-family HTH domain